jgi:hypothetical protein
MPLLLRTYAMVPGRSLRSRQIAVTRASASCSERTSSVPRTRIFMSEAVAPYNSTALTGGGKEVCRAEGLLFLNAEILID